MVRTEHGQWAWAVPPGAGRLQPAFPLVKGVHLQPERMNSVEALAQKREPPQSAPVQIRKLAAAERWPE